MIEKSQLEALERIRTSVEESISSLIRVILVVGVVMGVWMGLLLAICHFLTGGRWPAL